MNFNIKNIRKQFPILLNKINGRKFIYLDNAATVHKPKKVISALNNFYKNEYASVNRSIYSLSINATNKMENIRYKISKFINAKHTEEIIFTKSTTESINLIANTWGIKNILSHNNIIITQMEHHSNIIPWKILSEKIGFNIRFIPFNKNGDLELNKIDNLIDKNTCLISITYISNVLGTINPINNIIKIAKKKNITILIDGAQAVANKKIDVQNLNCDFFVFSGHKIFGPTGIGILYGKKKILELMPPWQGGGGMIKDMCKNQFIPEKLPWKFEAGSPNIAGIIGLGAAISWFISFNIKDIINHNRFLTKYTLTRLNDISNIKIFGKNKFSKNRIGIISFNLGKHHAYDVGSFLDQYGIAIRTGHHCSIPVIKYFNVKSMCRISFSIYNNKNDIDFFIKKLIYINNLLSK
ncbi:SufS family cysteine desulfurase [Enterobacteriaceae endosymbiont of Donacia bicoloricornis]|uniref:SufS family cysteine desulfurase n=1 Tax=Enterobacteriaceae endosymbiont of Donacia bicoloricornis TaxID=2675772 RepID=UPI00144A071E|nr:SufS family cysteine desulfurase [Enterobacteriaceae endosymbiont of Donacia bicoloricornis]QJC37861.1 SufS family cysteine desulfurase [Enterobacteriaceae endosymbiont of Donacia bicoloricornis]